MSLFGDILATPFEIVSDVNEGIANILGGTIIMRNLDHIDVLTRTIKTAFVAFLATWALSGDSLSQDALVTAGAAAGTAALNYILQAAAHQGL